VAYEYAPNVSGDAATSAVRFYIRGTEDQRNREDQFAWRITLKITSDRIQAATGQLRKPASFVFIFGKHLKGRFPQNDSHAIEMLAGGRVDCHISVINFARHQVEWHDIRSEP
jgi:hypothetical protein